jgi:prepilin-type processing-associated H-X9-DG protein
MHRGVLKIVAIAIPVLFLLGIGFAAIMRARAYSQRMQCEYNLGRVGLFGMWTYMEPALAKDAPRGVNDPNRWRSLPPDFQPAADLKFPPGTLANPSLPPERRLSWQVVLLPYVDREDVYAGLVLTKAWDDEANVGAAGKFVRVLACPSQFDRDHPALAHYIGMAGIGPDAARRPASDPRAGLFRYDGQTKVGELQRGLSYTLTIMESGRHLGPWAAGGPPTLRGVELDVPPLIGPDGQFGGHPQGANAAFADGSVRFQNHDIEPRVLARLTTLAVRDPE